MPAHIVFLSLFLGLVSHGQRIELQVDGPVKSIRLTLGDRELATLRQPPWIAEVDFGPELAPRELVAIGYDGHDQEIARASQIINLPRPIAEFEFVMLREDQGTPATVQLRWRHLTNARPKRASMTVDGKPLAVDAAFRGHLPQLDPLRPHVIAAELRFDDGFVARREMVIEGLRSDSASTQLTPVPVTQTAAPPANVEECFSAGGVPLRTRAVEKNKAIVVIVQDPDAREAIRILDPFHRAETLEGSHFAELHAEISERILWPIARSFSDGQLTSTLYEPSADFDARRHGMLWLLTRSFGEGSRFSDRRQFADAVAAAGLNAIEGGRRRAVVLVLDGQKDTSRYDPLTVRRYLSAVGVPLFVWSVTGPRPDLAGSWGEVEDISTFENLLQATERLRRTLESQRIAWLVTDPLTALRAEAKPDCGFVPVARAAP